MSKTQAPPPAEASPKQVEAAQETTQNGLTTVAQGGAVALPPDLADMILADQGSGLEKVGKEDLAIPRLALLQLLSDQCKKTSANFMEDAKAGDWYDSVLDKLYDGEKGIDLIFVDFRPTILQWYLRNNTAGSGFVADHGYKPALLAACARGPKGEFIPKDNPNTELVPTKEYFALLVDKNAGSGWPILVSFAKSQVKHSSKLNTLLTTRKVELPDKSNPGKTILVVPPMFYHMWHCTTVPETNKNKDEWMGWGIAPGVDVLSIPDYGLTLYKAARAYKEKVASGKVNVAAPVSTTGGAEGDTGDANENVPF